MLWPLADKVQRTAAHRLKGGFAATTQRGTPFTVFYLAIHLPGLARLLPRIVLVVRWIAINIEAEREWPLTIDGAIADKDSNRDL